MKGKRGILSRIYDPGKELKNNEKIRFVEKEILESRLKNKYLELGKAVYRNRKKFEGDLTDFRVIGKYILEIDKLTEEKKNIK